MKTLCKPFFLATISLPIFLYGSVNAEDKTQVSPHPKAEIRQGWNEVYCPTFQMALDSFNNEIIKGKIRLNKAQTLADILNGSPYKTDNLTPESFFAKSAVIDVDHSLKPDLIKEFIAKFGEQGNEDVLNDCREMVDKASPLPGFLAFAYLEKFLAFSTPFYVFKTPIRFSDGNSKTLTESFGISVYDCENNGKRNNITVGDYVDSDNFILILDANSVSRKGWNEVKKVTPDDASMPEPQPLDEEIFVAPSAPTGSDEIILAKMPPQKTLKECWELVKTRIKNSKGEGGLGENEKIQIPKVHIDQRRKYEELHGAGLLNPGFEQYFIADTLQVVKFDLNEKGAELRSYAMVIYAGASGIPYIAPPRSFILDKPFLMILRQKGKEPYLMCWIANSELLKKWEPDDKFVDFFEKGKADALSDISAKNNFYMVDKCGNEEKPETTEDLRQLIMKRDFGLKSKSPEDILKGDFRDDYIQGYNEIALGAVEKKMSVKLPKELEKRTKVECKKIHMLNLPTVSILLSLFNLQNPDGSWGNSDKTRIILTSLGTLALLGHGENVESEFFGKTFKKSLAYLTQNSEKRFQEFTPAEKAMVTLVFSEAWAVTKMQGLENPAKFAAEKFLESVPVSLDVWNVLALISISKNAPCDKEKSAKFAEKLKSLEGSEIARTLLEDKFFDQIPDDGRIDKFIDDLNCNWDDLALRDVEDTFALMILALGASNKDVWRKCNKKVVSDLVKRRTMDEKEMLAFYPAKWKADEMFNVKFDEKDALLLSSISGTLITFVYYRYLPAFKSRPIKSGP